MPLQVPLKLSGGRAWAGIGLHTVTGGRRAGRHSSVFPKRDPAESVFQQLWGRRGPNPARGKQSVPSGGCFTGLAGLVGIAPSWVKALGSLPWSGPWGRSRLGRLEPVHVVTQPLSYLTVTHWRRQCFFMLHCLPNSFTQHGEKIKITP